MEDSQIIDLYWNRSESAIAETAGKYGSFLRCIAHNILHSTQDAEECVNDTYLRTWQAIPPNRPVTLRAWLARITRNLSLDRWQQGRALKRGGEETELLLGELDVCIPAPNGVERIMEDQEIAGHISDFLRRQSKEGRLFFLRRYWYGESVAQIAARFTVSEGKVKSSLFRTRNALRSFLEQEGVAI